ncbi:MAG: putative manganese-dependent inorganic diphosphatase [Eubacterium sp.]|nr:putative manganese-dependent inorganic diphosphatase [Eubacterium sp.]MDY5498070.1 putative manganese-dependent inorganic diphosphatase [Anaerobutyricum sp.]
MSNKKNVYVIGHKNPDTDSICSAISYAYLKNELDKKEGGEKKYIPTRAGHVNEETQYVLNYFGMEAPLYVSDIRPQVTDIEIRKTEGVSPELSLKKAWDIMRASRIVSLPILEEEKLAGIITVGDIAYSDMDVYDNMILSKAHTSFKNIVETIDGEMIVGNLEGNFDEGHVLIAAANPDMMEGYIEPMDMVILGNRYESQLCAIEMDAQCIVVCMGATVSKTIRKLAKEHGCRIIVSPYDTYTVARLINHSMPIRYFMTTDNLITFHTTDFVDDIQEIMAKNRFRDFPIVDTQGKYIGMISRRNLLGLDRKKLILVDHNEKTQAVDGYEEADILEIIDHHRLGNIETNAPLFFRNQPVGCTATIVTQMYMENDVEIPEKIAGLLCSAILSDTLMFRSPTCTAIDRMIAEKLSGIAGIDIEKYAKDMFDAGSNLREKSAKEIFYQDFKKFNDSKINFGVGQISSMNKEELSACKEKLLPYMEEVRTSYGLDMVFFMMTDIINESTELLMVGDMGKEVIESAFHVEVEDSSANLAGVVSRKKQLIPAILGQLS